MDGSVELFADVFMTQGHEFVAVWVFNIRSKLIIERIALKWQGMHCDITTALPVDRFSIKQSLLIIGQLWALKRSPNEDERWVKVFHSSDVTIQNPIAFEIGFSISQMLSTILKMMVG